MIIKKKPALTICVWILVSASVACFYSCKQQHKKISPKVVESEYLDAEGFMTQLKAGMQGVDTSELVTKKKQLISVNESFRLSYQLNEYNPFWFNAKGPSGAADSLIGELEGLRWDGLNPQRYNVASLKEQLKALKADKKPALDRVIAFDTLCTKAYLLASHDLLLGTLVPKQVDSLWFHANDSVWDAHSVLLKGLGEADKYPSLAAFRSKIPSYVMTQNALRAFAAIAHDSTVMEAKRVLDATNADSVAMVIVNKEMEGYPAVETDSTGSYKKSLMAYQWYHALKQTGKIDSPTLKVLRRDPDTVISMLSANLERMRWMPQQMEDQYVVVDVPMMELMYRSKEIDTMHMRVVVGKVSRQTPSLNAKMTNIVFNPSWGVPPTILKKDVLPGLTQSGAKYLAKKGLRAYDRKGNPIDAGSINESNYKRYIYKQAPGDDNSLGVVKFNLPNQWDIYLHDTPHRGDFPNAYRALSSGCIRVQKPREFANFILTYLDKREKFTPEHIDSVVKTHKTQYEGLKTKIPVHIVYLTAYEDSTGKYLRFLNDIYKRDARVIAAMQE